MNNSDDPDEYIYSIGKIKSFYERQGQSNVWMQSRFQSVKESSFILSCVSPDEKTNSKFWTEYADKGNGVCIQLEIVNDPIIWDGFYFSKVKYGELERWDDFISEILSLNMKHPTNSYDFFFDMIFCLHKKPDPKYIEEKEIRILALRPEMYGFHFDSLVKSDVSKDKLNFVNYFKLPLYVEKGFENDLSNENREINNQMSMSTPESNDSPMWKLFFKRTPTIKITTILVGQDFEIQSYRNNLMNEIEFYFFKNLGYSIPVTQISCSV